MKIKIIKEGRWNVSGNIVNFRQGQTLEVGSEVSDFIASEMLRCGYAEKCAGRPKIETKEKEIKKKEGKEKRK